MATLIKSSTKPGPRQARAQDTDRHVGARMRERRIMLGLTQHQMAELIGVTDQQAHKYEERPAPDDEAGGAGRAGRQELEQEPGHRAGSVRRVRLHVIACEKTGRQARLVELDPRYCDVIVRRWQEWTGERAMLDGDGRSFEEVAAARLAAAA